MWLLSRLGLPDRRRRLAVGSFSLWLAACGLFSYSLVHFPAWYDPSADSQPAPEWVLPATAVAATIGGLVVLSSLIWPWRPRPGRPSRPPGRHLRWTMYAVLFGPLMAISGATSATANNSPLAGMPVGIALVCAATLAGLFGVQSARERPSRTEDVAPEPDTGP
jgi:hypothetical protein